MPDQPTVHIGELWADEYPGNEGRLLRVKRMERDVRSVWRHDLGRYQAVGEDIAICTVTAPAKNARVDTTGRTVRIAVRRMRPGQRGYRLVAYACKPGECTGPATWNEEPGADPADVRVWVCPHGRPFFWGEGWEPQMTVEEVGERLAVGL